MAGGKGTRIASLKSNVPKPMIEVNGKPLLEYQIDNLRRDGLTDITLVVGHLGHIVQDFFGDGSKFGVSISYFVETQPLGTAGALLKMPDTDANFLLLCGDLIIDVDFNRFIDFHRTKNALATIMVHPNNHPYDSALIETEILPPQERGELPVRTRRVVSWHNKEEQRDSYHNCVNAGIEIISAELLEKIKWQYSCDGMAIPEKLDLDRDILKPMVKAGGIYAYSTTEYIKDVGTPERFYETELDLQKGKPAARNLSNKQKAIFLDRDGTINEERGFVLSAKDIVLIRGAAEAIRKINHSEYLVVVVTNQPQIARGDCSFDDVERINNYLETLLGNEGAFIDAIYFCPHHTVKGFKGERIEYKCDCDCRKPKPGMLVKAASELNIDLSLSVMIGDSQRDIEAGQNAGCKMSIKIENNKPMALYEAVNLVLQEN